MTEETPIGKQPAEPTRKKSLVLINTGDGKGKSSAAFGVMGRSWARGWKTAVVQFIKGPEWKTGEQKLAAHLGVTWHTLGDGFTWDSQDLDESRAKSLHAWHVAILLMHSGEYDMVILDELTYLVSWGWLEASQVVHEVETRSPKTNVIITGRDATEDLIAVADTVTEMRKVKHAFDQGVIARKGIEY